MKQVYPTFTYLLVLFVLLVTAGALVEAQKCKPSGKVKGKKPPKNECNQDNGAERCEQGKFYTTYKCPPPVSATRVRSYKGNFNNKQFRGGWRWGLDHQNAMVGIMTMTHLWWHCQQDGSATRRGAATISPLMETEEA
ncbi:hypothetical protein Peur_020191 [Populus x canadensis]